MYVLIFFLFTDVILDYLNASTNFLDKDIAPKIVELVGYYIEKIVNPLLLKTDSLPLCVGMEVAGGVCVEYFFYKSIIMFSIDVGMPTCFRK